MSGSSSDTGRNRGEPRVADTPPRGSGSRSADTPTADSKSEVRASTTAAEPTVIRATDTEPDTLSDVPQTAVVEDVRTPEEIALDATPRTGPLPGDEPEANPSHPSSLRVRRSDGEPVLKSVRGGQGEPIDQPPGFEAAEQPRAVPAHPSKLVPTPDSISAYRLVDAFADPLESDADVAADVSDERRALATEPGSGRKSVTYQGSEAVTVIVPEGAGGYDGLITQGTVYNFRPGEAKPVASKHVSWLKKHPSLKFVD